MERFGPALRRAARELDLPGRVRTELLLEMAADLEAAYQHHRERGLTDDDAARRAEAAVLGSSEVIRRLARMHAGPWRGWAEEVAARWSGVFGLVLLAVGVLPVVALGGGVSVWASMVTRSSFAWLILLIGALMTALTATEVLRLLDDRPLRRPRLPTLLVLGAMAPALGLLAPVLGLQRVAMGLVGEPPEQSVLVATIVRDGATFLAGLLIGIGALLCWFVLVEMEARRAAREVRVLLAGEAPVSEGADAAETGTIIRLVRRRHG